MGASLCAEQAGVVSRLLPVVGSVGHSNERYYTRCTHWLCCACWDGIAARDRRCPICRYDLDAWFTAKEASEAAEVAVPRLYIGDHVSVSPDFEGPSEVVGVSGVVTQVGGEVITVVFDTVHIFRGVPARSMTSSPYGFVLDRRAEPVATE
jgi:hypothetical protein